MREGDLIRTKCFDTDGCVRRDGTPFYPHEFVGQLAVVTMLYDDNTISDTQMIVSPADDGAWGWSDVTDTAEVITVEDLTDEELVTYVTWKMLDEAR